MPWIVGVVLALAVAAYAAALRLDRERAFHTVVLLVVASYYVLFAAIGGSARTVVVETVIAGGFVLAASVGFRRSLWLVAAGLAAHGVLDVFHARLVESAGVPPWWPGFCGGYDLAAAACLAAALLRAAPTSALRARAA
ncbi:hypothetical protein [Roseisolibacter sp. H3M3-2]|uniref:hypothetical protein n=1 Tax=Roseisolibacter sp. H3M3-2 TaxID=3031323 RepID=UPI0023DA52F1|nr:hypothetical protein [Roseisolibacter sp. H3M3-2]MDF1502128.1 hypothetical protein [Roseisolibacter sp. H3M3-2]